jgi:NAD(P)-dependent dehydrogenase (short-subunit alcohol dehydrogenase family)
MSVLEGKAVLITGVARGCGRVLAEAFATEGARIVGCDIDVDGGRAAEAAARAAGGEMTFVEADVTDESAVQALVATAVDRYSGLDCAVNNAGTETTSMIAEASGQVFDRLIAVNLKGVLYCLKHEIAALRARGGGAIVNMSSVTSDITAVQANGLYAATKGGVDALTKGGVDALTKAAAVEVAKDNISVNALAFAAVDIPGDMFSRFLDDQGIALEAILSSFPARRLARPAELVAAVRYLCSEEARYVTGTMLVLDGGYAAQ